MFRAITQRLLGAALALSCLSFALPAAAETRELFYQVPSIGIELYYRGMGYNDADGNFIDLAGNQIVSSKVVLDFYTGPNTAIETLFMGMNVPVLGVDSPYFTVDGSLLTQVSPFHYTYTLTTDAFNGEIYSGRFAIEAYGLDSMGNPITLSGRVGGATGFYYTVDITSAVPEPASAALLLGGIAFVAARRRRAER